MYTTYQEIFERRALVHTRDEVEGAKEVKEGANKRNFRVELELLRRQCVGHCTASCCPNLLPLSMHLLNYWSVVGTGCSWVGGGNESAK